jgi:hypothetical protein
MLTVLGGLAEFERHLNPEPNRGGPGSCEGTGRADRDCEEL